MDLAIMAQVSLNIYNLQNPGHLMIVLIFNKFY